jgi:uncharacterized protein YgbK (DUF1537 family)
MIGIAADDLTGANDIGAMFSAAGFATLVFTSVEAAQQAMADGLRTEVAIIDTASRYDAPDAAYRKVAAAITFLKAAGCTRFFKKTCSVFRGSVGRELDAMLDALAADFAVVVAGYPRNRRTMVHGIQYVAGLPLAESHFAKDPFQPTLDSNLVSVLASETNRSVELLDADTIARGTEATREAMNRSKPRCAYLVFDVANETALRTIAEAVADERIFGGSAGLAGELAPLWKRGAAPSILPPLRENRGLGIPVVCGSLTPVTARQVDFLASAGAGIVRLDAPSLFTPSRREAVMARLATAASRILRSGRDAVIISPSDEHAVGATRRAAEARGITGTAVGKVISDALGALAAGLLQETKQDRLVLAGGETASAACAHLKVSALRLGEALEPGIPLCESLGAPRLRLVLKGGRMGADDLLARAVERLR